MDRNIDMTVRRGHGGYCITLRAALEKPVLCWAQTPYGEDAAEIGPMRGSEMWVESPDSARRVYFCMRSQGAPPLWAADTAVEIAAVENFRDMGGYRTGDGRTVRWGRFFRCGAVCGMDETEMAIYRGMRIRSLYDYRAAQEAARKPDVYTDETRYYLAPAIREDAAPGEPSLADMDMASQLHRVRTAADADEMYGLFRGLYAKLPFANDAYRQMLSALDEEACVPMIQHCSAGKDRTGVGCALLLRALGVAQETVMEDYLLSAIFRADVNRRYVEKMRASGVEGPALGLVARMMTVGPELLGASFAAIAEKYESFGAFLQGEYDVSPQRRARWQAMHTL